MKLDDDSLLSAFLDGELDTAARLQVEAALVESPELAERLQRLAGVRSALAALPRPTVDIDNTTAILSRIDATKHRRLIRVRSASLVAAAVLMLACVPLFLNWPQPQQRRVTRLPRVAETVKTAPVVDLADSALALDEPARPEVIAANPTVEPAELGDPQAGQAHQLRAMLEQPEVCRVVLVIDRLSPETIAQVRGAVIETGRQHPLWGELRVDQGLVVDSTHPDEARVFALLLDDREYQHFETALRKRLPDLEPELEPIAPAQVVTQLAELSPVQIGEGRLISPLAPPPTQLPTRSTFASKAARPGDVSSSEPAIAPSGNPTAGITGVLSDEPAGQPPPRVYLVWLTTSSRKS